MSQVQELSQQQLYGSMWKYSEEDTWEVRAFAEDTSSAMGTTWPPRSYTCNFCRREFRSAQALGGHMNVHRRDRARLRQSLPGPTEQYSAVSPTSMIFDVGSTYQAAMKLPTATALLGKAGTVRDRDDGSYDSYVCSVGGVVVEELDLELRLGW